MTKTRGKTAVAVFLGLVLSTTVVAGAVDDRMGNHQDRQTNDVAQRDIRGGSALLDDRVLSAESRHLLKVRDRDRRSDRGRGSHRGRGKGHRGHDYSYRHHNQRRYKKHNYYRHGRSYRRDYHDHYYNDGEPLLWYGLGVLTPYLLDDLYY